MSVLEQKLRAYAAKNNTATDVLYTALRLFDEMSEKAFYHVPYKPLWYKWLHNCSTIDLKAALAGVSYDENNLVHFNAMTLLDTVAIK